MCAAIGDMLPGNIVGRLSAKTRAICAVSLIVGIAATLIGLFLIDSSFWAERPYWTNMFSAFSGALIGVPFVVVVLHGVAATESEARQTRLTVGLLKSTTRELSDEFYATNGFRKNETFAAQILNSLEDCLDELVRAINHPTRTSMAKGGGGMDSRAYLDQVARVVGRIEGIESRYSSLLPERAKLESSNSVMMSRWRFIETYVRPRVLEAGLGWVSDDVGVAIYSLSKLGLNKEEWNSRMQFFKTEIQYVVGTYVATKDKAALAPIEKDYFHGLNELMDRLTGVTKCALSIDDLCKYSEGLGKRLR